MEDITDIEKEFTARKLKLLKNLEDIEKVKRNHLIKVQAEVDKYQKREAGLKKVEAQTSSQLREINKKILQLKAKDEFDKRRIKAITAEMKMLKKEMPRLEYSMKSLKPKRNNVAKHEALFSKNLGKLSGKLRTIESKKNSMQNDLDGLLKKEDMLRQGKIYWSGTGKSVKSRRPKPKAPARKALRPKIVKKISRHKVVRKAKPKTVRKTRPKAARKVMRARKPVQSQKTIKPKSGFFERLVMGK